MKDAEKTMKLLADWFLLILFFWLGFWAGSDFTDTTQTEAIEQGYAQHDPITGQWGWKIKEGGE